MNYKITQSLLNLNYAFGFILPVLPLPTTSMLGFKTLLEELSQFKILSSGISVESQSNKFSDLVMAVSLLNGQASLRISHDYFDLTVFEIHKMEESLNTINQIVKAVCKTLKTLPIEFGDGSAKLHWRGNLTFDESINHIMYKNNPFANLDNSVQYIPNAVGHKVQFKESDILNSTLVIVADELSEESLVAEFSGVYKPSNEPLENVEQFFSLLERLMLSLDWKGSVSK